ncbi:YecR family lipoprotein [Acerihabitans sp. TG2]|uniref:YecR family lipoprotein n=1 Tax=Acerihabitans sp. TG2 TaxID=3096008 RepID=UPI003A599261
MTFVGGDKTDGVVKVAYGYRVYEKPIVNLTAGRHIALAKCNSWGYSGVSQADKTIPECIRQSEIACNITYVTVEFQCSGKK